MLAHCSDPSINSRNVNYTLTREKTITTNICTAPISRHVPTSGKP